MRLTLICSVLALTALMFYAAVQSLPAAGNTGVTVSSIAELEDARAQIEANRADFDQQAAVLNQTIADLRAKDAVQVTALEATVAAGNQLQSQLEEVGERLSDVEAENAVLISDKNDLVQEVARLTAISESSGTASSDMQAKITELENEKDQLTRQLAELQSNAVVGSASNLTEEIEVLEEQVTSLTTEASNLSTEVAKRDAVIAGLMARTQSATTLPATGCQSRTDAALAEEQVNFQPGTTTIDVNSGPLLEELAAIASACVQEGLTLEIEGHTGSSGGVASNLLLSDGRAKAVRDALIESGVPAPAVRAVGFGGSEPVADNETSEGQSRNQRIVFDWEQN